MLILISMIKFDKINMIEICCTELFLDSQYNYNYTYPIELISDASISGRPRSKTSSGRIFSDAEKQEQATSLF